MVTYISYAENVLYTAHECAGRMRHRCRWCRWSRAPDKGMTLQQPIRTLSNTMPTIKYIIWMQQPQRPLCDLVCLVN